MKESEIVNYKIRISYLLRYKLFEKHLVNNNNRILMSVQSSIFYGLSYLIVSDFGINVRE